MHVGSPPRCRLKLTLLAILDSVRLERRGDNEAFVPILPGVFPRFILSECSNFYFHDL